MNDNILTRHEHETELRNAIIDEKRYGLEIKDFELYIRAVRRDKVIIFFISALSGILLLVLGFIIGVAPVLHWVFSSLYK